MEMISVTFWEMNVTASTKDWNTGQKRHKWRF